MKDPNFNEKPRDKKIDLINKIKGELFTELLDTVD